MSKRPAPGEEGDGAMDTGPRVITTEQLEMLASSAGKVAAEAALEQMVKKCENIAAKAAKEACAAFEARISLRMDAMERAHSSAAASVGGNPQMAPPQGRNEWTKTKFFELKNQIPRNDWKDGTWESVALMEPHALHIIGNVHDALDPERRAEVDWARTRKALERRAYWAKLQFWLVTPSRSTALKLVETTESEPRD